MTKQPLDSYVRKFISFANDLHAGEQEKVLEDLVKEDADAFATLWKSIRDIVGI